MNFRSLLEFLEFLTQKRKLKMKKTVWTVALSTWPNNQSSPTGTATRRGAGTPDTVTAHRAHMVAHPVQARRRRPDDEVNGEGISVEGASR
jgi:hypothetical protein